jgi:hypothetical protein
MGAEGDTIKEVQHVRGTRCQRGTFEGHVQRDTSEGYDEEASYRFKTYQASGKPSRWDWSQEQAGVPGNSPGQLPCDAPAWLQDCNE